MALPKSLEQIRTLIKVLLIMVLLAFPKLRHFPLALRDHNSIRNHMTSIINRSIHNNRDKPLPTISMHHHVNLRNSVKLPLMTISMSPMEGRGRRPTRLLQGHRNRLVERSPPPSDVNTCPTLFRLPFFPSFLLLLLVLLIWIQIEERKKKSRKKNREEIDKTAYLLDAFCLLWN
jgi:hypothetical protein